MFANIFYLCNSSPTQIRTDPKNKQTPHTHTPTHTHTHTHMYTNHTNELKCARAHTKKNNVL